MSPDVTGAYSYAGEYESAHYYTHGAYYLFRANTGTGYKWTIALTLANYPANGFQRDSVIEGVYVHFGIWLGSVNVSQ
jgi:hypothetical protein